jgi:hypothetical protein
LRVLPRVAQNSKSGEAFKFLQVTIPRIVLDLSICLLRVHLQLHAPHSDGRECWWSSKMPLRSSHSGLDIVDRNLCFRSRCYFPIHPASHNELMQSQDHFRAPLSSVSFCPSTRPACPKPHFEYLTLPEWKILDPIFVTIPGSVRVRVPADSSLKNPLQALTLGTVPWARRRWRW